VGAWRRDDRGPVPDPLRGAQRSPRPRALRGRAHEPLHAPEGPALLRAGRPVRARRAARGVAPPTGSVFALRAPPRSAPRRTCRRP
jgi:hypothetical protein